MSAKVFVFLVFVLLFAVSASAMVFDLVDPASFDANFAGATANDRLGFGGVAFGDADADGFNDDLILTSYWSDPFGRSKAGEAYLILNVGSKSGEVDLADSANFDANFAGATADDELGSGGVAFGDADADGFNDDLILQAHWSDPFGRSKAGEAYLILNVGDKSGEIDLADPSNFDANFAGATADDRLGSGGVAFGDADADGFNDDLILQAWASDPFGRDLAGEAYLILNVGDKSGEVDLADPSNFDANFAGAAAGNVLGAIGVAFGDADADGFNDDLILQSFYANPFGRIFAGEVYLILNVGDKSGEVDLADPANFDANFAG
ncbi:MAG: hypothetical protein CL943_00840, partial [Candidatus Diapherotrites archaeon]|nr:hypothetical protein [Candidatus Diapherotrites archaeon]